MKSDQAKVRVFGTALYSPCDISAALARLRVSHAVAIAPTKGVGRRVIRNHYGFEQPLWVHVSNTPVLQPQAINLISLSFSELNTTNFPRFPAMSIDEGMVQVLESNVQVVPKIECYSPMDYVNMVAKPSLLNFIQTELYKINPYALRKETQGMILKFFNSQVPVKTMVEFLQKSLRQDTLVPLLHQGLPLRDAVARLGKETVEEVARTSGYSTFDLLYLSKVRKIKAPKSKHKPKESK